MRVLFDTSTLVAAILVSHPQHPACFARLQLVESRQVLGFVSTHSLAEMYSVMNRLPVQPRITPHQAQIAIAAAFLML